MIYDWDCGWPGITKEQCEEKGCCYDPDRLVICMPFFKGEEDGNIPDCGWAGITKEQCEKEGCSFYPNRDPNCMQFAWGQREDQRLRDQGQDWATFSDIDVFVHDAFPGDTYEYFKWDQPSFHGFDLDFSHPCDCTSPYPSVYFDNEMSASLFRGEWSGFPMDTNYADTTWVERPGP